MAAAAKLPMFVEKPVAETPAEILALFKVAEEHGVPLCCGFQRRWDDSYVAAKRAIRDEGRAGDVVCDPPAVVGGAERVGHPTPCHVQTLASVFFGDSPTPPIEFLKQGGDPFMDLAPHDIDFVRWVLQDVRVVWLLCCAGAWLPPVIAALSVYVECTGTRGSVRHGVQLQRRTARRRCPGQRVHDADVFAGYRRFVCHVAVGDVRVRPALRVFRDERLSLRDQQTHRARDGIGRVRRRDAVAAALVSGEVPAGVFR